MYSVHPSLEPRTPSARPAMSPGMLRTLAMLLLVTGLLAWQLAVAVPANAKPGDLDPSFGTGGTVTTTDLPGPANALVVQADGKLVAAGAAPGPGQGNFGLARYNANGALDPSFGTGGKVTTDFADEANALVVQGGKLVAGGSASTTPFNRDFALARYQTR